MMAGRRARRHPSLSFRRLFFAHYASLRRQCVGFPHPGLALAAFDEHTGRFRGSLSAAHEGKLRSIIVGRHHQADLYLDHDPTLSLRHLAVLFGPGPSGDGISARVLDLRTPAAFEDEHGRRYASLFTDGPLMLRGGGHALVLMMTGPDVAWPKDPHDAWRRLPPREFVDAAPWSSPSRYSPTPSTDVTLDRRPGSDTTLVRRAPGPVSLERHCLLAADEDPFGTLHVTGLASTRALVVGEQAVQRGVLMGRYDRCDLDGDARCQDDTISRVHLLLVSVGGQLHAIDTASRNGTRLRGRPQTFRHVLLSPGDELQLGRGSVRVRWDPA